MARPRKSDVDYFPHDTSLGQTIFILESRWGNDGYAVWFKLLEALGRADGHYLDCRKQTSVIYLAAQMRVDADTLLGIFDLLAELEAIDRDLWQHKLIYCQHFVDRVADAYKRRRDNMPSREKVIACTNIVIADINPAEPTEMPQREREREREIKEKPSSSPEEKRATPPCPPAGEEAGTTTERFAIFEFRMAYQQATGELLPGGLNGKAQELCLRHPRDKLQAALDQMAMHSGKSFAYLVEILKGKPKTKGVVEGKSEPQRRQDQAVANAQEALRRRREARSGPRRADTGGTAGADGGSGGEGVECGAAVVVSAKAGDSQPGCVVVGY